MACFAKKLTELIITNCRGSIFRHCEFYLVRILLLTQNSGCISIAGVHCCASSQWCLNVGYFTSTFRFNHLYLINSGLCSELLEQFLLIANVYLLNFLLLFTLLIIANILVQEVFSRFSRIYWVTEFVWVNWGRCRLVIIAFLIIGSLLFWHLRKLKSIINFSVLKFLIHNHYLRKARWFCKNLIIINSLPLNTKWLKV